ncbi:MAG: bifunctional salicylyl-CoA 5-hydroxylase/oxidoreductase [Thermoanaerobaculia bacterium]
MRIVSIGGGPAGLYFSILMKKALPGAEITVYERNRPDDTFGWGVVFSDETLDNFERADPESFAAITANFRYWKNIETYYGGDCVVSTGHGFAALSRKTLLLILQERCRELGVELLFEREVAGVEEFVDADLILGADGINSIVRKADAAHFQPRLDWRQCRFSWLGTDKPLDAFTFIFKESEWGLFQVHAYPFEDALSTWILECQDEVWRRAGLAEASEEETVAFAEKLFAEELDGHRLLANRSLWRQFPTVRCHTWHHGNVVLMGDAAHTAHFSIGSGTKLAMEDALILAETFQELGTDDVPAALQAYEDRRWVDVVKLQKAAQTSLEWFENSSRYLGQDPVQFTFNLMTRSKRITYDNLRERDPQLIERVDAGFPGWVGASSDGGVQTPPIFTPLELRGLELANRVVVSPMCQYSAVDGTVGDWHLVHLGSRAVGGAGLIITEMTDVSAEGRISAGCAGMYAPDHVDAWKRIVDFVHASSGAKIGIQLAHAGRKGSVRHPWQGDDVPLGAEEGAWQTLAPSAEPFRSDWPAPRAMDRAAMERVRGEFVRAARMAAEAGFDWIEVHMAHGYLLSSFISPLANRRDDEYGGSLANRMRYPLEVFRAMREAWPEDHPMSVRISATDWLDAAGGVTAEESVILALILKENGCDAIDVSSAGNSPDSKPAYGRMYQVPFADRIRHEVGIPVMAVGALLGADYANTVLAAGRADLAVMARPHLRNPYLTLHAAERYELWDHPWPGQYDPAKPRPPRPPVRREE